MDWWLGGWVWQLPNSSHLFSQHQLGHDADAMLHATRGAPDSAPMKLSPTQVSQFLSSVQAQSQPKLSQACSVRQAVHAPHHPALSLRNLLSHHG